MREGQDSAETTEELRRLKTRVRLLELDNRKLREELISTAAELGRLHRELHPLSPAVAALTGSALDDVAEPSASSSARKRRWRTGES